MKYKCILFDCDGVLVDSEAITNQVLITMASEVGANISKTYARDNFGGRTLESIFEYVESLIDKKLPADFEQEFRKRSFQLFKTDIKPVKGIHELLDKISLPYAVASSGPMEKMKVNLTATGLIKKFGNNIFSSYDIGSWKPEPGIFLHAAAQMGHTPSDCLVVEDTVSGVQAAQNGGFDVVALARQHTVDGLKKQGAKVIWELKELEGMVL
jgi:HAD superfamily hydrolase (TIGR01509 family)